MLNLILILQSFNFKLLEAHCFTMIYLVIILTVMSSKTFPYLSALILEEDS